MQKLSERMLEDLRLRNCSLATQECYLRRVQDFIDYFDRRAPAKLGESEIRRYLLHLVNERHVAPATQFLHVAALKFFFRVTLRRPGEVERIPYPKVPIQLPRILGGSQVDRLLNSITSLIYRTICYVIYGAGLRVREACSLKPADIDSVRGVIHVRQGKGMKDRDVMLGEELLLKLRYYWRVCRPQGEWLFPSRRRPERPLHAQRVRDALHRAAQAARLKQRVTPHLLRHCFATHMLEMGHAPEVIQLLLGHRSFRSTQRYTQLRAEYVARIKSPLDVLGKPEGQILR